MKSLAELGEAARRCSNLDYQMTMRAASHAASEAINAFFYEPTIANMIALNGAWAHATRVLANVPPEGAPAPLSGPVEAARLAA